MSDLSKPGKTHRAEKMRALAKKRTDLPENWLDLADELDAATIGFFSEPQTVSVGEFMRCMIRARKAWCAATGESMI